MYQNNNKDYSQKEVIWNYFLMFSVVLVVDMELINLYLIEYSV